jgi:hypothetical protein
LRDEARKDREIAEAFEKLSQLKPPENMTVEDMLEVQRGAIFFMMRHMEKLYMHIIRNSALTHDTYLWRDMASSVLQFEHLMELYYQDYLDLESGQETDEEEETDGEPDTGSRPQD